MVLVPVLLASMMAAPPKVTIETLRESARSANIWEQPIGKRMEFFARQFLGTPYVAFTLDPVPPPVEHCIVVLDGLDCVTFMETVLNLARTPKLSKASLEKSVTLTRYWGGKPYGYPSRLHYTTDWVFDNERKKVVVDYSKNLPGAAKFTRKVGYMTANPDKYSALKTYPALVQVMAQIEVGSNIREKWFVPIEKLAEAEPLLQTGDIIGLAGGPEGIDISHVGIIVVEGGVPHFVHASSVKKEVTFDVQLSKYLAGSKTTGIIVARPIDNLRR